MSHVFISYSRKDSLFANDLRKALKKRGHEVWTDTTGINGGDQWRKEIDDAIYGAYVVVLVLSPDANKSSYVTYEWSFALGIGTPIIPVVVRNGKLHPRLETYQKLDYSGQSEPDWTQLIDDLDGLIDEIPSQTIRGFYEFRTSLRKRKQILRETGKKTFYQYIGGLSHHERGFRLKDEDWALQCNSAFWGWLAEHQEKKCKAQESILAFATHTASPEIWLSEEAGDSLAQQRSFIENGGKIARVFVGPCDSPTDGDVKYKQAMALMRNDYKIDSFYVKKPKTDNTLEDYTWIPSLNILQTWTSRINFGDHIQVVDLSETDEQLRMEQARYWSKLKLRAKDIEGTALKSYPYFSKEI